MKRQAFWTTLEFDSEALAFEHPDIRAEQISRTIEGALEDMRRYMMEWAVYYALALDRREFSASA